MRLSRIQKNVLHPSSGKKGKLLYEASSENYIRCPINNGTISSLLWLSYSVSKASNGDSLTLWRRSALPVRYELDCKYCYK
jgi:hypothetical protein